MIQCLPASICSWNYLVRGEGHQARLDFNWASEQGAITIDGTRLDVRKHGFASGRWSASLNTEVLAEAHKPSSMSRTFHLQSPSGPLLLEADSVFSRNFGLHAGDVRLATLATKHLMTRRGFIQRHPVPDGSAAPPDFATLCFSFWLTALIWKRSAQSSS